MHPEPTKQHEWLRQFVGEWAFESTCDMGPGQPPVTGTGTETVRMLGDLWVVAENRGEMPGCGEMCSLMTLGFDPMKGKFVGNWIGSPMAAMFVYEGALAPDGVTLPLDTEGPGMADPTTLARYQDVIEIHPDGRRMLNSQLLQSDGTWQRFNTVTYRRTGG